MRSALHPSAILAIDWVEGGCGLGWGACSKCRVGHQGRGVSTQLFATLPSPGQRTTIFSHYPTMLQCIITGNIDIKFELVKLGEYMNRDSIKVQSYATIRAQRIISFYSLLSQNYWAVHLFCIIYSFDPNRGDPLVPVFIVEIHGTCIHIIHCSMR